MRDRRFVARHRGGPLPDADHRALAAWAADAAARALERVRVSDERPAQALDAARAWAGGDVATGVAQRAAWAAHAAAREAPTPEAVAACRAAGNAAATAHMADHSLGAAIYACRAVAAMGTSAADERAWQMAQLPVPLRSLVASALASDHFETFDVARDAHGGALHPESPGASGAAA